jgi:ATP-dependent DNA helicase RecG
LSRENREILLYLLDNDKITKKDVVNLLNCEETKAKTILKDLLKMNLIVRIGKGRNTHYCLKKKYKDF